MKKLVILFLLLFTALTSHAITVKLKITYNDAPVADCDVTIKQGDVALGQGRTNSDGDVEIEVSVLAGQAIDVYGSKQAADGEKKWDVKGYVKLDDDNFYHLQMEIFAKQMAQATGMPEATIAGMWGILVGGSNDAPATPDSSNSGGQ
jgi:hypothetical protein